MAQSTERGLPKPIKCHKEIAYASTLRSATQGAETQPHRARGTAPLRPSGGRPAGRRCQSGTRSRFSPKRLASAPKRTQEKAPLTGASSSPAELAAASGCNNADRKLANRSRRHSSRGASPRFDIGQDALAGGVERRRVGDDRNRGRWTGVRRGSNRCRCLVLASS